ncbi:MAG: hypothetical protein HQL22_08420 [Candidatus Omnitrophica bacterium]|nr:hypothetical protein [Candidatus Omnitrophota bacterium]
MIKKINEELLNLWDGEHKKGSKELTQRWPLLFQEHVPSSTDVLFVGINPSYDVEFLSTVCKGKSPEVMFKWEGIDASREKEIMGIERVILDASKNGGEGAHSYHTAIKNLMEGVGSYNQIDLFPVRETDHRVLKAFIKCHSEFFKSLLNLWSEAVLYINPRLIVVVSAMAAHILDPDWENEYRAIHPHGLIHPSGQALKGNFNRFFGKKNIPVVFSGMLSGGAIDVYSRERLCLSIINALKNG